MCEHVDVKPCSSAQSVSPLDSVTFRADGVETYDLQTGSRSVLDVFFLFIVGTVFIWSGKSEEK